MRIEITISHPTPFYQKLGNLMKNCDLGISGVGVTSTELFDVVGDVEINEDYLNDLKNDIQKGYEEDGDIVHDIKIRVI